MLEDASTPAVVLGCFRHGGLGVTRSLGRLGVPVHAVDGDRCTPAFFSRYCRERHLWDVHAAPAEETARFLVALGERLGRRSVLIPTTDIGIMLVADHADLLRPHFAFPERDAGLVRSLCSKREMYRLAKAHGVPAPETAFPTCRADVLAYLETAKFPILLKAIYGNLFQRTGRTMLLVRTERELLERYDEIEDPSRPNLILQEYIDSGEITWVFNGYFDRNGGCDVAFTGKKLRNFPPYFGQGSIGVCEQNEVVLETTVRFMRALGYTGPLDIGYRYDARDGLYKVHDVNPRLGAMFRLFVGDNGMDVARAIYRDMTGQPVPASSTRTGRKWILEDADAISGFRYFRDGKITLKEWVGSLRGVDERTYLVPDDLGPMVGVCLNNARRSFQALKAPKAPSKAVAAG